MKKSSSQGRILGKIVCLAIITLVTVITFQQLSIVRNIGNSAFGRSKVSPLADKSGYELVFQDEFDNDSLDISKWSTKFYWGRTHKTHYMTYFAPDAFEVVDGKLRIKAKKKKVHGYNYTGGIITTFKSFSLQYGYVEMKVKLPKGKGIWPAFWLGATSKKWPPEIDIFELLGHEPNKVYLTNQWKDVSGARKSSQKAYIGGDFSAEEHIFSVEWTPSEVIWYIDNLEKYRTNQGISQEPMYLLAALTVGGDWPGAPDDSTIFPAYMDIDFIRVFKKK